MAEGKRVYVYVDNSNLWIEGKRMAGAKYGETKTALWRLDFGKLLRLVGGGRIVQDARMYGSRPPPNDTVWEMARQKGFKVTVLDRNSAGKEKGVDTELVLDVIEEVIQTPQASVVALVAGDGDYQTLPARIKKFGWDCEVYFWSHAAKSLQHAAPKFIPLDGHIENVGRWAKDRTEPDFVAPPASAAAVGRS